MNKEEYLAYHEAACKKMLEITRKKNADYTGTGTDPFANFSRVAHMGLATTEQGFLVRMLDKLSRLGSFVQRGSFLVDDESFEDTCLDLANYAILLAGYMKSQKALPLLRDEGNPNLPLCSYTPGHKFAPISEKYSVCEHCRLEVRR